MRSIRRRRWWAGSCRKSSPNCADCWKHGCRNEVNGEYVQVLRLLETFSMAEVTKAVEDALRLRAISFDAVKHLLLCRIEQRPPRLDLQNYPYLPMAQVATTAAADCLALLTPVQEGVL